MCVYGDGVCVDLTSRHLSPPGGQRAAGILDNVRQQLHTGVAYVHVLKSFY